jgi:uncharacterized protein YlaN (UPF0358 family)
VQEADELGRRLEDLDSDDELFKRLCALRMTNVTMPDCRFRADEMVTVVEQMELFK